MGAYTGRVVKPFIASGPGQLSLKVGDVVEVQTGDTAWSLGRMIVREQHPESLHRRIPGGGQKDGWFPTVCISAMPSVGVGLMSLLSLLCASAYLLSLSLSTCRRFLSFLSSTWQDDACCSTNASHVLGSLSGSHSLSPADGPAAASVEVTITASVQNSPHLDQHTQQSPNTRRSSASSQRQVQQDPQQQHAPPLSLSGLQAEGHSSSSGYWSRNGYLSSGDAILPRRDIWALSPTQQGQSSAYTHAHAPTFMGTTDMKGRIPGLQADKPLDHAPAVQSSVREMRPPLHVQAAHSILRSEALPARPPRSGAMWVRETNEELGGREEGGGWEELKVVTCEVMMTMSNERLRAKRQLWLQSGAEGRRREGEREMGADGGQDLGDERGELGETREQGHVGAEGAGARRSDVFEGERTRVAVNGGVLQRLRRDVGGDQVQGLSRDQEAAVYGAHKAEYGRYECVART
jgi:hypothetical protein